MRRPLLITLLACWLALPAAGVAQAPRQTLDEHWTTTRPSTSFGRSFKADFFNPDDPDGKPHAIERIFIRFHPGTTIDTTAVRRCEASDAELTLLGPAACPPDSRVGKDTLVADTGLAGPARFATIDSDIFNGEEQWIFVAEERQSGARVVVRGEVEANTVDIRLPFVPGTPPEGAAPTSEEAVFFERSTRRDGRQASFFTTPPSCPASREWTIQVTYTYRDGVSQTARDTVACTGRRASATPGGGSAQGGQRAEDGRGGDDNVSPRDSRDGKVFPRGGVDAGTRATQPSGPPTGALGAAALIAMGMAAPLTAHRRRL